MFEAQRIRFIENQILEVRMIEVICLEIFKGPDNFVIISNISNFMSSHSKSWLYCSTAIVA